jgi:hypothetical protein
LFYVVIGTPLVEKKKKKEKEALSLLLGCEFLLLGMIAEPCLW